MQLFTPDIGLIFWMLVVFVTLVVILGRFVWPVILQSVRDRADLIDKGVSDAASAAKLLEETNLKIQTMLRETRSKQMQLLQESNKMRDKIIADAHLAGSQEVEKLLDEARLSMEKDKAKLDEQFRSEVSKFSLDIAEKLLQKNLQGDKAQQEVIDKMLNDIKTRN